MCRSNQLPPRLSNRIAVMTSNHLTTRLDVEGCGFIRVRPAGGLRPDSSRVCSRRERACEPVLAVNIPVPALLGPDECHLGAVASHDALPGNLPMRRAVGNGFEMNAVAYPAGAVRRTREIVAIAGRGNEAPLGEDDFLVLVRVQLFVLLAVQTDESFTVQQVRSLARRHRLRRQGQAKWDNQ